MNFHKRIIIGTLFSVLLLCLTGVASSAQKSNELNAEDILLKKKLIEKAEELMNLQMKIIAQINSVRSGVLIESDPLESNMFSDAIYLLKKSLSIDSNDIKGNFLLGKIYYIQIDLADEINVNAVLKSKKYLETVKSLCKKNCEYLTETDEMLETINWKTSDIKNK